MFYKKYIFLIASLLFFVVGNAQLTTQKKYATGFNNQPYDCKIIDLKSNGILLYSSTQNKLIRLNNNYDTVWVKSTPFFSVRDGLLNSSNEIILSGVRSDYQLPLTNNTPIQLGFQIVKLDLNGNLINSKYKFLISITSENNPAFYLNSAITEYKPNLYLSFFNYPSINYSVEGIKLDNNLNILQSKSVIDTSTAFNNSTIYGLSIFKKNDNQIVLYGKNNYNFYYYSNVNRNCFVIDTNINNTINLQLKDTLSVIHKIDTCSNDLIIVGSSFTNKLVRNQFDTGNTFNGFLTKVKLINTSVNKFKSILFTSSYIPRFSFSYYEFSIFDNSIYIYNATKNYNNNAIIHDSLSRNIRTNIYKFDTALHNKWSKRLHIVGTKDTTGFQEQLYGQAALLNNSISGLLIKNNQILFPSSLNKVYGNNVTDEELGFVLSAIDTTGNNATCNSTVEPILFKYDTVELLNKTLLVCTNDTITFQAKSQAILNDSLIKISNVCLPIKKTKSKFDWYPLSSNVFNNIVCKDSKLILYDRSYNEPKTWHWILPPQANITELDSLYLPNVQSISFNQAGVYPVSLVTENDAGKDTSTQYITVINFIPQPNLGNDTTICFGDTLKIIYQNPPNSLHNFSGPNIYTASDTLKVFETGEYVIAAYTACGYLYDTINVNVASKPTANFGFTSTCNNLNVIFSDSSLLNSNSSITYKYAYKLATAPATAYTNFSTTSNNNYTFPSYDSFDIRLIVTSPLACVAKDTIVKRVVLKAKPTAGFSYTNSCGSLQANITSAATIAAGSITTQQYYVGNTLIGTGASFVYTAPSYGSYTIKHVTKSNFGCISDTVFVPIIIKAKPSLSLSVIRDSVCLGSSYIITANSTVAASSIINYTWLRNGIIQPTTTNQLTDNQPTGTYTYKVITTAANGCKSDTVPKIITVVSKPTATFSATNTCGSKAISITAGSSVINDNITNYYTNYGDNNTLNSNPNNTTYTYTNFGAYIIKFVAKSSIGCLSDTVPFTIAVKDKPSLSLSTLRDSVCLGSSYTITANSNVAASTITNYTWLRNGIIQPTTTNQLTDNQPTGTYTYKVITTAVNGCKSDTATKIITVVSKPTANLNATNTCGSKSIAITSSASVINDNINSYYVNYGDGTILNTSPNNNSYTYTNYGSYTIKFVAKSSVGCINDTVFVPIVVKDKPTLSIIYNNNACDTTNFILTANATVNASSISSYTWLKNTVLLPNNTNSLTQNNAAGTYFYQLVTTAATGCKSDTASQNVIVQKYPKAIFTADNGCVNKNIIITNNSTIGNGQGDSWQWTASNGQISTAQLPTFSFATSGTKTIQLKTSTTNGCADSLTKTITIDNYPIADFTITESCLGKPIAITNNSSGTIANYSWTTNNGLTDNSNNPNFVFNSVGNYSIKLQVATANNCSNDITKSTSIQAVQLVPTPRLDTNVVVGQPVQLGIAGASTYTWSPSINLNNATSSSPIFTASTAGEYVLQVEGTTAQGCKGSTSTTVKVFIANNYVWIPNAFTPNGDNLNDRLRLTCSGLQSLSNFSIFNRYGELVYLQSTCNGNGWDGTYKGKLQPIGAFVYTWAGTDFKGKAVSGKGTVLLVK